MRLGYREHPLERLDLGQAGGKRGHAGAQSAGSRSIGLRGLLLRNPLSDVSGDRDRPLCDAVDRDQSEGHLDIGARARSCAARELGSDVYKRRSNNPSLKRPDIPVAPE